jgi:hypothetical protein
LIPLAPIPLVQVSQAVIRWRRRLDLRSLLLLVVVVLLPLLLLLRPITHRQWARMLLLTASEASRALSVVLQTGPDPLPVLRPRPRRRRLRSNLRSAHRLQLPSMTVVLPLLVQVGRRRISIQRR